MKTLSEKLHEAHISWLKINSVLTAIPELQQLEGVPVLVGSTQLCLAPTEANRKLLARYLGDKEWSTVHSTFGSVGVDYVCSFGDVIFRLSGAVSIEPGKPVTAAQLLGTAA